ncbi:hypothetical protein CYLTODRAFT_453246 [Cylindrobasidium torrendii FP15055 ss-10]|uniref:Wax synthase domain-containing protein n=1 Tax=Cylindrobasidium torrendii FP15055 ss-10 TaxID=1314674 RepID=A0A0D7BGL1_9AGAR|nr:hypothetical protein CYLTODRAFT_453246 [Cylindrobasidium torrendii FP15055 ss-10]
MLSIPLGLVNLHFGDEDLDLSVHCFLAILFFVAVDWIVIHEPQIVMRQKNQRGDIQSKPFLERLAWGIRLLMSLRGVGWDHQPRGLRPPCSPKTPKLEFIASSILYALGDFLLMDAGSVLLRIIDKPYYGRPLASQSLITFGFGLLLVGQLQIQLKIMSVFLVSVGYSKPQDFAPAFGYWSKAHNLRKFWSEAWHQFFRRCLSAPGVGLVHALSIPRGTNASAYTQLYSTFIVSGFLHVCTDYTVNYKWSHGPMIFFVSQAVGITVEDTVAYLTGRVISNSRWQGSVQALGRMIGYAWVFLWMVYTLPFWLQEGRLIRAWGVSAEASILEKVLTRVGF